MSHRLVFALLVLVAWMLGAGMAMACPGCKDALAAMDNAKKTPFDPDPAAAAEMFSWTVLLMLGTMLSILGGFVGSFYWMIRRAAAQTAAREVPAFGPDVEPA
jgi:hypothetical protein